MDFTTQEARERRAIGLPDDLKGRPVWLITKKDREGAYKIPVGKRGAFESPWDASRKNPANWYTFGDVEGFSGNIGAFIQGGLCCLDFDKVFCEGIDNARALQMIEWIESEYGRTYSELSNSGNGLHVLFYIDHIPDFYRTHKTPRILLGIKPDDKEPFVEIFCMGKFVALTGNTGTAAPIADFSRKDGRPSILERLIPWTREHETDKRNAAHARQNTATVHGGTFSHESVMRALSFIPCRELDRLQWVRIGMALQNDGFTVDIWDAWSKTDAARYHEGECAKLWKSFHAGKGTSGAMIYAVAKEYGYEPRTYENDSAIGWNDVISGEA